MKQETLLSPNAHADRHLMPIDVLLPTNAKVFPVIHLKDLQQCLRNAEMAFEEGADGVFVIHMSGLDYDVEAAAMHLKLRWPERFIGTNYLSRGPLEALGTNISLGLDGTWSDSPGVTSTEVQSEARAVATLLKKYHEHKFFGSVAFKYKAEELNPPEAAWAAHALGMIATTSGTATGSAPPEEKLSAMRNRLGCRPLALASGLTPENVGTLAPYLTHLLVATGISEDFHNFDRQKLRAFVKASKIE